MRKSISQLPEVKIRDSVYKLDDILKRMSAANTDHTHIYSDFTEALLCLGNEIKKIKEHLKLE
mgnify:CR=1 FL=1